MRAARSSPSSTVVLGGFLVSWVVMSPGTVSSSVCGMEWDVPRRPTGCRRFLLPEPGGATPRAASRVVTSQDMELDDGLGDDKPVPPLLPPDDRVWRHPSEVAAAVRRRKDGRVLPVAALSGVIGALLATGVIAVVGDFDGKTDTIRTVVQREASPLAVPVAAGAGYAEVAEKTK